MNIIPKAKDMWEGLGKQFDSISQVICEFIDNCISNFNFHNVANRAINITINRTTNAKGEEKIIVLIEDGGTGIINLEASFTVGNKSCQETQLNEHGFGFKHALAAANPENNAWRILTRNEEDFKQGIYKVISYPYSYDMEVSIISVKDKPWDGIFNGSGTIFEFECPYKLFQTIRKGTRGNAGFYTCLDYLREELGYVYSGIIEEGKVIINIISNTPDRKLTRYNNTVGAVKPSWEGYYNPMQDIKEIDLGGGKLKIQYAFGDIVDSTYTKYYKRSPSTSGVEIRVNGRILMTNLFKDIWGLEQHPSYNHFLVTINLISENRLALPRTRTTKNSIAFNDEKLWNLYDWIKKTHPTPPKQLSGAVYEKEIIRELAVLKNKHIRSNDKHIECEFKVFNRIGSPVSVDLYVYDGQDVVLYEAKKDKADMQNLYQLLLYWDGAVSDGIKPTEAILIASSFSPGVDLIIELINLWKDENGNNYNFSKKTWEDEGIDYPKK